MKCTYLGKSKKEICNYLNNNNIVTPLMHKMQYTNYKNPNTNNNKWTVNTITNILKDQIYIGDLVQHKYSSINYKIKKVVKVKKEEYVIIKNNHEPIISQEEFSIVEKMLQQKANECKRNSKSKHILTGITFCKNCGARITYTKNHGEKFKIICSNYKKNGKKACNNIYIEEQEVIKLVKQEILNKIEKQNINNIIINSNTDNLNKIYKLQKEKTKNLKNIKQIYDDIQQGDMDKKIGKEIINQYILENKEKERIIKKIERESREKTVNILDFISNADENQLRSLIFYLVEKIEISKQEIVLHYKFEHNK